MTRLPNRNAAAIAFRHIVITGARITTHGLEQDVENVFWIRFVREIEFDKLVVEDSPRQGGDAYEYAITYRGRTVRARETALPGPLRPLVELLDGILNRA